MSESVKYLVLKLVIIYRQPRDNDVGHGAMIFFIIWHGMTQLSISWFVYCTYCVQSLVWVCWLLCIIALALYVGLVIAPLITSWNVMNSNHFVQLFSTSGAMLKETNFDLFEKRDKSVNGENCKIAFKNLKSYFYFHNHDMAVYSVGFTSNSTYISHCKAHPSSLLKPSWPVF